MKIFLTGGTGFIGTHLVRRLSQTKHTLYCLARPTSNIHVLKEVGATIITGDVTDKESLLRAMKGCDWVVHLASNYVFWQPKKRAYGEVNIRGTQNVLESAWETSIAKIVYVSTLVIYGKPDWPITEASPVGPVRFSEYARTKYEGDLIAWEYYEKKGLPLVTVYPGAVLGKDDPKAAGRYVKNFAFGRMPAQIFTDVPFPFVYVGDVCEVILRALEKEGNIGEKYIATKFNLTFGEFNNLINDISGVPLPKLKLPHSLTMFGAAMLTGLSRMTGKSPLLDLSIDQMRTMKEGMMVDASKAERELGITFTPIRTALEEAIASYKQQEHPAE